MPPPRCRGSSPHARGAHRERTAAELRKGLIPARAGSTLVMNGGMATARAHPRTRGEHTTIPCACLRAWGSSPHARGAPRS
ncbi:hypothetical protein NFA_44210 [Nocardia farcinica IFM 10152]|nr:hypothetical protein NFA_44210 [Nocardia farcinica IFM 10152]